MREILHKQLRWSRPPLIPLLSFHVQSSAITSNTWKWCADFWEDSRGRSVNIKSSSSQSPALVTPAIHLPASAPPNPTPTPTTTRYSPEPYYSSPAFGTRLYICYPARTGPSVTHNVPADGLITNTYARIREIHTQGSEIAGANHASCCGSVQTPQSVLGFSPSLKTKAKNFILYYQIPEVWISLRESGSPIRMRGSLYSIRGHWFGAGYE